MRADLDLTGGLVVAEAVMMALAPLLGFATGLRAHLIVPRSLGGEWIDQLCDPSGHLGSANAMSRAVVRRDN
ncbi:hypothetical protein ACFPH6_47390 [Streptomyces xiangluensis]|uniref:Adenylosuccinate lyase C-terminal domain-containing protein n=1 Tax=Streptomyces xiangluensis TaxID=2665720 RepID=A0ABV8Z5H2_9ACTN